MFHIGHLNLLKRAKKECDYLIVGVSSDELVMEYKGKLPVIPYADRSSIVESLSCVDKVVVQSHRDKIQQFKEIKYHKLFVGDDWKGDPLFNELEAKLNSSGAELVYFEYTKSVSSTKLNEILQSIYDSEKKLI